MSISGNLKTMALAELLQWLAEGQKTGTLRLDNGLVEKKLHFFEGRVISTSSTDPKEYLGHFLVSHGLLGEDELAKAVEMQETNKMLLGKILTTIGILTAEELDRMLRLKSEETIYDLFSWKEAEFSFFDDDLPEGTLVPIDLNVTSLILRGTQRQDEWEHIRAHIPSPDCVAVGVRELTSDDPNAHTVLQAVDDNRTIAEIAMETHASQFHVSRILVDQVESGALKVVRPRGSVPSEPDTLSGGDGDPSAEALLAKAERLLEEGELIPSLRHLRAAKSLEPDSGKVRQATEAAEKVIHEQLEGAGIVLTAIPRLSDQLGDLHTLDITPDEGFVLSRINGSMDIGTILKISPMPRIEAQIVLLRLRDAGHITLG
jgi:hypothetical protein